MTTKDRTMAGAPGASTQRVLLIRHAEKPTPDGVVQGVDEFGRPLADELSVLGWQRAGALAASLAGADGSRGGLFEPRHLYAARPTSEAPSVRSVRTLQPLADVLGLSISLECAVGEEERLAFMLSNLRECALVAWEHRAIVSIAPPGRARPEAARQLAGRPLRSRVGFRAGSRSVALPSGAAAAAGRRPDLAHRMTRPVSRRRCRR
jgi:broad specificity phosphatase PhoE